MRLCLRTCASAALLLLSGAAQAQDGAASLIARFAAGFATLDPTVMAALFRPDATFFGSTEPDLLRGPEGVRGYFERSWPPGSTRRVECEVLDTREVSADAAMLDALCRVESGAPDGTRRSGGLRVSALALRDGVGWCFAALHASAPPAPRR